MDVALIDYGSGNLRSAAKAFERVMREADLPGTVVVTADPERLRRADRIVLPGVGAFADCRRGLLALPGMADELDEQVLRRGKPFLGICVGMQLMATIGHEHGDHAGLGWIPGHVAALTPADPALKIPHMGWNELSFTPGAHPLLSGIAPGAHAYFVHGYHVVPADATCRVAEVDYGGAIVAVLGRDNLVGTQFHPEKSQATGLALLANFLRWCP
jgi:glutamine amidotransferase